MKKIFTLILMSFAAHAQGQELLYPAKYQVYRIVRRSRHVGPNNVRMAPSEQTWNVRMIMLTQGNPQLNMYSALIHNTAGGEYYRTAVGPAMYTLMFNDVGFEKNRTAQGDVAEFYPSSYYDGQLTPPKSEVSDPSTVLLLWGSDVVGNKILKVLWASTSSTCSRDGRQHQKKCLHDVTFYCKPGQ